MIHFQACTCIMTLTKRVSTKGITKCANLRRNTRARTGAARTRHTTRIDTRGRAPRKALIQAYLYENHGDVKLARELHNKHIVDELECKLKSVCIVPVSGHKRKYETMLECCCRVELGKPKPGSNQACKKTKVGHNFCKFSADDKTCYRYESSTEFDDECLPICDMLTIELDRDVIHSTSRAACVSKPTPVYSISNFTTHGILVDVFGSVRAAIVLRIEDLIGELGLWPMQVRQMFMTTHWRKDVRLKMLTFFIGNGLHPQVLLEYVKAGNCVKDQHDQIEFNKQAHSLSRHVLRCMGIEKTTHFNISAAVSADSFNWEKYYYFDLQLQVSCSMDGTPRTY